ncbi:hypothetical protein [Paraburkholderia sp. MM5477-R1]|uniref:hypothetical protein n=1 Tax=Paraburkholderia sp. MM5477-R1 TaxID=2991062 RepID=UPI003D255980
MKLLITTIFALGFSSTAFANPYDDCILQNMKGAKTKEMVFAIERACIGKTSVDIPDKVSTLRQVNAFSGNYNTGYGDKGTKFLIKLENTLPYDITEIKLYFINKKAPSIKSYVVDVFNEPLPQGAIVVELGEPGLAQIIKANQSRAFVVNVSDLAGLDHFNENYDWVIYATKGIPLK